MNGKVALVTGAASGIGAACAAALAGRGAMVVVADIDLDGAAETLAALQRNGGAGSVRRLDVADEADWAAAIAAIAQDHGALHILVNNAAICIAAPLLEMSLASWRRQVAVNLDSVFLGCRAALTLMTASGGGSIVNISSVAGLQGIAGLTGYCATKGGVRLFTKALALECARAGGAIRVNSIHPGAIESPIWAKMANDGVLPAAGTNSLAEVMDQARAAAVRATPLGFAGVPADIAEGVVYLCSDAARFVTGAELVIDGGVFAG